VYKKLEMEDYSDFIDCMECIADKLQKLQSDKEMAARYKSVKNSAFKCPKIDLAKLEHGESQEILDDLYVAMVNDGFLTVENHGVDKKAIDDMINLAKQYYHAPVEQRRKCRDWNFKNNGFYTFYGISMDHATPYDIVEVSHWEKPGRPTVIEPVTGVPKCEQQKHKIIDSTIVLDPEKTNKICYAYQLGMMNLAKRLVHWFEVALGLAKGRIAQFLDLSPTLQSSSLSCNCYGHTPEGKHGIVPHRDNSILTILMMTSGQLQAKHKDKWFPLAPIPNGGSFLVNFGNILEYISCGVVKATLHKARNTKVDGFRYSFANFFIPAPNKKRFILPELKWNMSTLVSRRKDHGKNDKSKWSQYDRDNGGVRKRNKVEKVYFFCDWVILPGGAN